MDLGSVLLIFALLLAVVLFVARPFFERTSVSVSKAEHDLSQLLAERDRILNALQELEFDNLLGKIPEQDYPEQRTSLLVRGAEILRKLDEIQQSTPSRQTAEERLEAAVAVRRMELTGATTSSQASPVIAADDQLEAVIAERRRARAEKSAGFCHNCGGPLQKSDRFCSKCGTSVV